MENDNLQKSTDLETELGATIVETNYEDEDGMVKILEENKVEVVISTMPVYSEAQRDIQIRLVRAADLACTTKRFVPSDFSYPEVPEYACYILLSRIPKKKKGRKSDLD